MRLSFSIASTVSLFLCVVLPTAQAQKTLDNFDAFASNLIFFNGSWGTPVDQFVQNVGSISITGVGGGNPQGDGSFDADSLALGDYSGLPSLQLTARLDSGNTSTGFTVQLRDSLFTVAASGTFLAASFNSASFTAVSIPLLPGAGDISDIAFYTFNGDTLPASVVRASFSDLQAVPEPSIISLLTLGGTVLVLRRRRKNLL